MTSIEKLTANPDQIDHLLSRFPSNKVLALVKDITKNPFRIPFKITKMVLSHPSAHDAVAPDDALSIIADLVDKNAHAGFGVDQSGKPSGELSPLADTLSLLIVNFEPDLSQLPWFLVPYYEKWGDDAPTKADVVASRLPTLLRPSSHHCALDAAQRLWETDPCGDTLLTLIMQDAKFGAGPSSAPMTTASTSLLGAIGVKTLHPVSGDPSSTIFLRPDDVTSLVEDLIWSSPKSLVRLQKTHSDLLTCWACEVMHSMKAAAKKDHQHSLHKKIKSIERAWPYLGDGTHQSAKKIFEAFGDLPPQVAAIFSKQDLFNQLGNVSKSAAPPKPSKM